MSNYDDCDLSKYHSFYSNSTIKSAVDIMKRFRDSSNEDSSFPQYVMPVESPCVKLCPKSLCEKPKEVTSSSLNYTPS